MSKIEERIVEHIIDVANNHIVDVIGDFLTLRKTGVRYTAICPFHDDHHDGNFFVYPARNCYRCFTCEAKGDVVKFLMETQHMSFPDAIRYLGKKYGIEVDDIPINWTPPPPKPPTPPKPTLIIPFKHVKGRVFNTEHDNLCNWIRQLPWSDEQREMIPIVLRDYLVGHATIKQDNWYGEQLTHEFTVFWQLDIEGNPRTAHYMKYSPDGHRVKKEQDRYNQDWFHSLLERNTITSIYDPTKQEARQCLYGEHLLTMYPDATACIVESEKTALLMAIAYGNNEHQLWLACCGSSNITRERLAPLFKQNRRIMLYPDRDGIKLWTDKMSKLEYSRCAIHTSVVTDYWKPEDGAKADIADVVIRMIYEQRQRLSATTEQQAMEGATTMEAPAKSIV